MVARGVDDVVAGAALQDVQAVAAVEPVVAVPAVDAVVAVVAVEGVVAAPAAQDVVVAAALDEVVPGAAVEGVPPAFAVQRIRVGPAVDPVLPVSAVEGIGAAVAEQPVVAIPAQEPILPVSTRQTVAAAPAVQRVAPAPAVDDVGGRDAGQDLVLIAPCLGQGGAGRVPGPGGDLGSVGRARTVQRLDGGEVEGGQPPRGAAGIAHHRVDGAVVGRIQADLALEGMLQADGMADLVQQDVPHPGGRHGRDRPVEVDVAALRGVEFVGQVGEVGVGHRIAQAGLAREVVGAEPDVALAGRHFQEMDPAGLVPLVESGHRLLPLGLAQGLERRLVGVEIGEPVQGLVGSRLERVGHEQRRAGPGRGVPAQAGQEGRVVADGDGHRGALEA